MQYKESELLKGATIALKTCMGYKPGETVLIITDTKMKNIGNIFYRACLDIIKSEHGGELCYQIIEPTGGHGHEPPENIAGLMKQFSIILMPTFYSLSHTQARQVATKSGARIASMPGITEFSLAQGGMTADYNRVAELTEKMFNIIKNAQTIRIISAHGTDLTMKFGEHKWMKDTGLFHKPGEWGNLPAGEVCTAPNLNTANGTLIINHMGYMITEPTKILIRNGIVAKTEDKELEKIFGGPDSMKRNIAELGIGTNPAAKDNTSVLECEKIFGTIHIGFGNNTSYGGDINVRFHEDAIVDKPILKADGRILIKNGEWKI